MKTVIKLVSSGLYTSHCPAIPGTAGSVLGLLIYLQVKNFFPIYIFVCLLLIFLGFLIAGRAEEIYKQKDSRKIVIDEIAGMMIVYLGIPPKLLFIILGFFIYRIFDVIKPHPAARAEALPGSAGIMLDDIICAVYTNIILQVLARLPLNIGS